MLCTNKLMWTKAYIFSKAESLCFHENHCDTQLWARAAH